MATHYITMRIAFPHHSLLLRLSTLGLILPGSRDSGTDLSVLLILPNHAILSELSSLRGIPPKKTVYRIHREGMARLFLPSQESPK